MRQPQLGGCQGPRPAAPVEPSRTAPASPRLWGGPRSSRNPRFRPGLPKNLTHPQRRPPHAQPIGPFARVGGGCGVGGGTDHYRTVIPRCALSCRRADPRRPRRKADASGGEVKRSPHTKRLTRVLGGAGPAPDAVLIPPSGIPRETLARASTAPSCRSGLRVGPRPAEWPKQSTGGPPEPIDRIWMTGNLRPNLGDTPETTSPFLILWSGGATGRAGVMAAVRAGRCRAPARPGAVVTAVLLRH